MVFTELLEELRSSLATHGLDDPRTLPLQRAHALAGTGLLQADRVHS